MPTTNTPSNLPTAVNRRSRQRRRWSSGWNDSVDLVIPVEGNRTGTTTEIAGSCGVRRKRTTTRARHLWHGTRTGTATKLKPSCLRVRLPPVLLETKRNRRAGSHRPYENTHESVGQLVVQPVCKTGATRRWGFDSLSAHSHNSETRRGSFCW